MRVDIAFIRSISEVGQVIDALGQKQADTEAWQVRCRFFHPYPGYQVYAAVGLNGPAYIRPDHGGQRLLGDEGDCAFQHAGSIFFPYGGMVYPGLQMIIPGAAPGVLYVPVVVGRSPPDLKRHRQPQQLPSPDGPAPERGRLAVIDERTGAGRQDEGIPLPLADDPPAEARFRTFRRRLYGQGELYKGCFGAGRNPHSLVPLIKPQIERAHSILRQRVRQPDFLRPASGRVQEGQIAAADRLPVPGDFPGSAQMGERPEIQTIDDDNPSLFQPDWADIHRPPYRFDFQKTRGRRAVGHNQTVHAEIAVVMAFPEISAV